MYTIFGWNSDNIIDMITIWYATYIVIIKEFLLIIILSIWNQLHKTWKQMEGKSDGTKIYI